MKTNLVDLMSRVAQLEKEHTNLSYELRTQSMNIKIIELDGHEQMLEEYPEFMEHFNHFMELGEEITKLKGIIFEKNNSLTLENGDTIQKALVDIQIKRRQLDLIQTLAKQNPSKKRTSETNNSYFTSRELAYDRIHMKRIEDLLIEKIQKLELEISQLNSQMFEISL